MKWNKIQIVYKMWELTESEKCTNDCFCFFKLKLIVFEVENVSTMRTPDSQSICLSAAALFY